MTRGKPKGEGGQKRGWAKPREEPPHGKQFPSSENPKRHLKRQQPWNDAKSHAPRWASDSSFHGCWLGLFVVWRLLWVQLSPLHSGPVEKSSFHGCYRLGAPGGWIATSKSRSFVAVVVSWPVWDPPISRDSREFSLIEILESLEILEISQSMEDRKETPTIF